MKTRLIIEDEFLPGKQAEELHGVLMAAKFQDEQSPADGVVYPNICKEHHPEGVEQLLAAAHGRTNPVDIKLSCYRLSLLGEKDDTFCHADGIYADWAAVLYLTRHTTAGGTAFWTSRLTGLDAVPDDAVLAEQGFDPVKWHTFLTDTTKVREYWEMNAFCGMKFNRLVTYPCKSFHSRMPGDIGEPFGDRVDTGRLVWVAFYNLT